MAMNANKGFQHGLKRFEGSMEFLEKPEQYQESPIQYLEKHIQFLEERIKYLEEVNRFTLEALDMAASLGDFQPSIKKLQDTPMILNETKSRIGRLIEFEAMAFLLVDQTTHDFALMDVDPDDHREHLQKEVDFLIDNRTFAWVLKEARPVIIPSRDYDKHLVLHVMATSSRIRGMFMGMLNKSKNEIPDLSLSLLSVILQHSSNAIESLELYSTIRDITNNLEKKENYRVLFEAAPDGVEVLDGLGKIVDCNNTHKILLGYRHDEIIGNHTTRFISENSKGLYERKFAILKETGYVESEVELVCRDGSIITVWRKEKAIFDEGGNFVGAVIYNRDMSAQRKAEEEKISLQAQLQRAQKMEALGTLAGGVAHDLNNILAGLVSCPDLLLMQIPNDSQLKKTVLTIQRSGEKAAAIVQDLLTLGRRGVAVTEVANLNNIINDYLRTPEYHQLKTLHPKVGIEKCLDEKLLNTLGSPVHLFKTIMNLVSNAAEAMPEGGRLTISTENQYIDRPIKGYDHVKVGDYVLLKVTDTGMGIGPNDLERIFEPFYTKKEMGRSGTGLGMAVVWGTVKDHGGYIDVASIEGEGTTFTLYFPVTREELAQKTATRPTEELLGRGETILVVDDMEDQRNIASQILTKLGYFVSVASNGEEAVEMVKNNPVDLVVLDMIMDPGIDGLETYRRILQFSSEQKAILVSGFSETERVKEAERLGAGAYIRKPFLFETFAEAVRSELER